MPDSNTDVRMLIEQAIRNIREITSEIEVMNLKTNCFDVIEDFMTNHLVPGYALQIMRNGVGEFIVSISADRFYHAVSTNLIDAITAAINNMVVPEDRERYNHVKLFSSPQDPATLVMVNELNAVFEKVTIDASDPKPKVTVEVQDDSDMWICINCGFRKGQHTGPYKNCPVNTDDVQTTFSVGEVRR